jgi:hypothetical protein
LEELYNQHMTIQNFTQNIVENKMENGGGKRKINRVQFPETLRAAPAQLVQFPEILLTS